MFLSYFDVFRDLLLKDALACVAAVSFPFPGGEIEQASAPGVRKKLGGCGGEVSEKGKGVGRKGIATPPPPAPYFSHALAVSFPSCAFLETRG